MTGQGADGSAAHPIGDPQLEANQPASRGVDVRGGQGVQINEGGTHIQNNNFFHPPLGPAIAAVTVVVAVLVPFSSGLLRRDAPASSPEPRTSTSVRAVGAAVSAARVTNAPRGMFGYPGPFADPQYRRPVRSFFEGDVLRIVCQEKHGRLVTDSSSAQSTVWYKLDIDVWVSHLYADHLPEEAGRPSPDIPDCTYE